MLLHIISPNVTINQPIATFWTRLTPQTRLVCSLLTVFAITLTPNGEYLTWALYAVIIFSLLVLSKVNLLLVLKRAGVEFLFVWVVLLGILFNPTGDIIWSWGVLRITTGGLTILSSVTVKLFLCLMMMNLLILTTPISALLQALIALKTPPLLVAILGSMYRYLNLLIQEANNMKQAALSRNLLLNPQNTRLVVGGMIGSLFIRTYERGERIYQAMLGRGYQGDLYTDNLPKLKTPDLFMITLTVLAIVLGQMIYLYI